MGGDFGLTRMIMALMRAQQRDVERERRWTLKMKMLKEAETQVEDQNHYIQTITSSYKECSFLVDWQLIVHRSSPEKPVYNKDNELKARQKRENYVPGFWIKLFKLIESKIKRLDADIEQSKLKDEARYNKAMAEFTKQSAIWERETNLARCILSGDIESYKLVIREMKLWSDVKEIGHIVSIDVYDGNKVGITLKGNSDCIPRQRKKALKSGVVSETIMPTSLFFEIYYRYVCSSAIRVIREIFAILPVNLVQVNIIDDFTNTASGHTESLPILSLRLLRDDLKAIEWDGIDPLSFIGSFEHHVNFKKTKGFSPVSKLDLND